MKNKLSRLSLAIAAATSLTGITSSLFSANTLAHAEHDKARYVSADGVNNGRCDNKAQPCKSIEYAAKNANKGDRILVASGTYQVESIDTLFYLSSAVLPVETGYSKKDGYHKKSKENLVYLTGVPLKYADELNAKGFQVVVDTKGLSPEKTQALNAKLSALDGLRGNQINEACTNGKADVFDCNNIDLLAHVPLQDFNNNTAANDIWGFVDLNDNRQYAIIGLRAGVSVVDVTEPTEPRVVGTLSSQSTIWRDIKVYQRFNSSADRWESYAYVTADSASVGMMILDLTKLPEEISLARTDKTDLSAHNVYLSNADYTTGTALDGVTPHLHITGSNNFGGGFNSYKLSDPVNPREAYKPVNGTRALYTHDASSMVIDDARKDTQCVNGTDVCEVFMDFNEQEFFLWDKTINSSPEMLSSTTYNNASYVHSGWWSEDKRYVLVHDELDEQRHGLNTTVRLFDISDLTAPKLASIWTGTTPAIDHNGFVRGNRYYLSNYERGMTVLDISNPRDPVEVGFFDTFPTGNNASFNGGWGVYPYLDNGILLVSDINSGLYVLKDKTAIANTGGTVSFTTNKTQVDEGGSVTLTVSRTGDSSKAVSVDYNTMNLSATTDDYSRTSGTLSWAANDSADKTITVATTTDAITEGKQSFAVKLNNPVNGLGIGDHAMQVVTLNDVEQQIDASFSFTTNDLTVKETDTSVSLTINRSGTDTAARTVNVAVVANSAGTADATLAQSSVNWAANDTAPKTVTLNINNDDLTEETEQLTVRLSHANSDLIGDNNEVTITIRDDESNQAPAITAPEIPASVAANSQVSLTFNATDPEGSAIIWQWRQTAGTTVSIANPASNVLRFTAPSAATTLTFAVEAIDDFEAVTEQTFSVNVTAAAPAPAPTPAPTTNSSGGGGGPLFWLIPLLTLGGLLRRKYH